MYDAIGNVAIFTNSHKAVREYFMGFYNSSEVVTSDQHVIDI